MKDFLKAKAVELASRLLRNKRIREMIEFVDVEDILTSKKIKDDKGNARKAIMLGEFELDAEVKANLKRDAISFESSFFWKILRKHLKWKAYQTALGGNDLKAGQDIMLTLRFIDEFIKSIDKEM